MLPWLSRLTRDRHLLALLALTLFAWAPLLASGYFFQAHDARHSVFFLVEFDRNIRDGVLWPRWGPDHALGFGYPLWIFYSPASYYVAEVFHLLGAAFTTAVKLTWWMGFIGAAWAMYAFVRSRWGPEAGLIAGLLYTYAPYHLVDIYVRAALAEFVAFIFFPLALWAFLELVERGGAWRLALAALAYGAVILTHAVTGLGFTPVLVAVILFALVYHHRHHPRRLVRRALLALGAGVLAQGLSAIFLLPMLLERGYIVQEQWVHGTYNYAGHFVYPHQFLSFNWGYGYSVPGPEDGFSLSLGLWPVLLGLGAVVASSRVPLPHRALVRFLGLLTLGVLWFMTPWARPVWDALPLLGLIQFPWRFLAVTTLLLAVLGGALLSLWPSEEHRPLVWVLALAIVVTALPRLSPPLEPVEPWRESPLAIVEFETTFPDMVGITRWSRRIPRPEESPLIVRYQETGEWDTEKATVLQGKGEVTTTRVGGASVDLMVRAEEPVTVLVYTYWFPGWTARTEDGVRLELRPEGEFGLIAFDLPAGEYRVFLRFQETPDRVAGGLISLVSLGLVIALLWRRDRSTETRRATARYA